jgi:hypothetical protein
MDFTWLHDMSPSELAIQEAYFGLSDPAFLTFLGSLGMRSYAGSGAAKTAWTVLREEASERGWGDPIPPGGSGGGGSSSGGGGGGCGAGGGIAGLITLLVLLGWPRSRSGR